MGLISLEIHENVGVVKLNRGVTNAINLELVNELAENLKDIRNDSDILGLVLTSSNNKFFAIGFDIPELFELNMEGFREFYQSFNRLCLDLYTLPKPTIAALSGHAIAGGCILALCCDYRLIAEGRKLMGLNEIKLGVPIPYPADCMLRELVGVQIAREVTDIGDFYPSDKLLQMGMVDHVFPLEQLQSKAIDKAKLLGTFPAQAFQMIKYNRIERVETQIRRNLAEKEQFFLECWYSEEARALLREAIKKF
ncbi:MAG: enoyl-CoA hydratase/isomerase family protein [Candidatus Hodarchaeota archaeon]